ncbi:MAG: RNA 2',3'-cyclic phosphodiesterase [Actinomycetota bacterium]
MARDRASRPEAKPLRLFVAVEIPEVIREELSVAVAPLRERWPKAKWVPQQNQHVTVKFLGRTWPRLQEWVTKTVEEVASGSKPFESRVTGLGTFPGGKRTRVLWAGLEDASGRFADLAAMLDAALSREFKPEERRFTPHLTVARFNPPEEPGDALDGMDFQSEPFTVDRLVLYRSHLQRPAPVYEPLKAFPLAGP